MICGLLDETGPVGHRAYNGAGHDEGPPGGRWVGADSLEHGHAVFEGFGLDGTASVVVDLFRNVDLMFADMALSLVDLGHWLLRRDVAHDGGVGVEMRTARKCAALTEERRAREEERLLCIYPPTSM